MDEFAWASRSYRTIAAADREPPAAQTLPAQHATRPWRSAGLAGCNDRAAQALAARGDDHPLRPIAQPGGAVCGRDERSTMPAYPLQAKRCGHLSHPS